MFNLIANLPIPKRCSKCLNEVIGENKLCDDCKAKIKIRKAAHYQKNKALISEKGKVYRKENAETIKTRKTKYATDNKEKVALTMKLYYIKNKEKFAARNKQYREDNKAKLQLYRKSNRIRLYNATANYRAKRRHSFIEHVDRRKIFERDKFICQICGLPTNPHVHHHDPLYPTLDHTIPLNKNGTHEPNNVQCAHFSCNSKKGDRI